MAGKTFSEFTDKTLSEVKASDGYLVGYADDENVKVAASGFPTKTSELTNDIGFLNKSSLASSVDITNDFTMLGGFQGVNGFKVTYFENKKEVTFRGQVTRSTPITEAGWVDIFYYNGTEIDFTECTLVGFNFGIASPTGGSAPEVGTLFGYIDSTTSYTGMHFALKQYTSGTSYGLGMQTVVYLK